MRKEQVWGQFTPILSQSEAQDEEVEKLRLAAVDFDLQSGVAKGSNKSAAMSEHSQANETPSPQGRIFLVVDDDPMVRKIVARGLSDLNPAAIIERDDGLAAQEVLLEQAVDVVITDVVMPHMDGLALMKWAQEHRPGPLWIVLSGVETFDAAVEALQLGAFDYLAKPPQVPRVRVAVRNALDQIELVSEKQRLYDQLGDSNQLLAEKVQQLQTVCRVLEDQAATIQADLNRAEVIQRALLPQQAPSMNGWCMETLYRPGSSVGGDFYDAINLGADHLGIVIADAAGHGVAAAMLSVLFKLRFSQIHESGEVLAPARVLAQLNEGLYDELSAPGAFITAAYLLVDLRSGEGRLASAGHPPCVLHYEDGRSETLRRTGPALGLEANPEYDEHRFSMGPGSRALIYTDGVIEGGPHGPSLEDLGTALASSSERAAMLETLFDNAIRDLEGDRDDVTMLLLEHNAGDCHLYARRPAAGEAQARSTVSGDCADKQDQPHVQRGERDKRGFIALIGSVSWLCAEGMLNAARELLEEHAGLTVDLSCCDHMDSTCLGTLHEIAIANPDAVELQGASATVIDLFEELSMRAVLSRLRDSPRPLPDTMALVETAVLSPQQQGARILSAHETLLDLSADNEAQFRAVVDALRADMNN